LAASKKLVAGYTWMTLFTWLKYLVYEGRFAPRQGQNALL